MPERLIAFAICDVHAEVPTIRSKEAESVNPRTSIMRSEFLYSDPIRVTLK